MRRHKNVNAFTLIELLLVVVLLGTLAGVVFPRLKGSVRAAGLEESTERLAAVVRFARMEAVHRGLKVRLTVGPRGDRYALALQNAEGAHGGDFTRFDDELLDADHRMELGVRLARIRQGEQVVRSDMLVFRPDGIGEPCSLELADDTGRTLTVNIGAWVDQVAISRGKGQEP